MELILNHTKLLCLRPIAPPLECKGAKNMHRNLHTEVNYFFYSGVRIENDNVFLDDPTPLELYRIKTEELNKKLEVNICAIVGENGSGKSSIIDLIVRIINNLAAYILGEYYRNPKAEHLHFIDNVYAELYILMENTVYAIRCEGRKISVYLFNHQCDGCFKKVKCGNTIDVDLTTKFICEEQKDKVDLLRNFCYTVVNNYSLYSFNPLIYENECTNPNKEIEIRRKGIEYDFDVEAYADIRKRCTKSGDNVSLIESRSWLQGLFHKNDGYQVPIVITPMRERGVINVIKEYELAKERLLSLVFLKDESGKHFFKRINGKLIIDAIRISKNEASSRRYASIEKQCSYLPDITDTAYKEFYAYIKEHVAYEFKITVHRRNHDTDAWNYIIHKILKIIFTYPNYAFIRQTLKKIRKELTAIDRRNIRNLLLAMWQDHSHVTTKLFRTIYYLHYDHIGNYKSFQIESFSITMENIIKGETNFFHPPQKVDELLPPPIFCINFMLYDVNDVQKRSIPFNTLSSGEKQITYTLTSFYYHLVNIDSIGNVAHRAGGPHYQGLVSTQTGVTEASIEYRHINAIFDEVELYFHPEMQRTFISNLLDGLRQINFRQLYSLHIMMVSHSPFILSDIPYKNILFLDKNGMPKNQFDIKTFGANIHTMLRHSFFLEKGAMGEFAQQTIQSIILKINLYKMWQKKQEILSAIDSTEKEKKENLEVLNAANRKLLKLLPISYLEMLNSENVACERIKQLLDLDYIRALSDIIQEPLVKDWLNDELSNIENSLCGF